MHTYSLDGVELSGNSKNILWYMLKDSVTGEIKKFRADQVKMLLNAGALVSGLELKNGRLTRTNTTKQRKVRYIAKNTGIEVITGENLIDLIADRLHGINKERYIVSDILKFCRSDIPNKVCLIHGIRRTGKTTAMLQAINNLLSNGINAIDILYLNITKEIEDIEILKNIVIKHKVKFVFIDEITFIRNLYNSSSWLSDVYSIGRKVIITGTDSYVFPITLRYALYDRAVVLHSTLISYDEHLKIFNTNIRDYMVNGGMLVRTEFSNLANSYSTLRSVVLANIRYTLQRNNIGSVINSMTDSELIYFIFNILNMSAQTKSNIVATVTKKTVVGKRVAELLAAATSSDKSMWLGIDKRVSGNKILANEISNALAELNIIRVMRNITKSDHVKPETDIEVVCLIQSLLYSILSIINNPSIVVGTAFESMVLSNICMWKIRRDQVRAELGYTRYNYKTNTYEIDAVLCYDNIERVDFENPSDINSYVLIEVKSASRFKSEYAKNLLDKSLDIALPGKKRKIVVYGGESMMYKGIYVLNAHEFLLNLDKWLDNPLDG